MSEDNPQKRLRVMHSAALLYPSSGMLSQMEWEQEAAQQLGIDWQVKMYCPNATKGHWKILHRDTGVDIGALASAWKKLIAWVRLRLNYHRWLLQQQDQFDVFLLRYYVHDPFQLWFALKCKKNVYFVHHTLEVPELALPGTVFARLRSLLDGFVGRQCIAYSSGIIGVTQEIADYEAARSARKGKRALVYPNGIVFKYADLPDKRSTDVPEFLFVANFSPWHGLDLLLQVVAQSRQAFVLHLVGSIPDDLMPLANDARIRVHGSLKHDQISKLSQQCWIGLASFALWRKKMSQACPLKAREYLMLGLPVYGDYEDVFPDGASYYKRGSESIDEIIAYAMATRKMGKAQVAEMAREWVDKKQLLDKLYAALGRLSLAG